MKKILICTVLILMTVGMVSAQEKPAQAPMPKYIYRELTGDESGMNVSVDMGQELKGVFGSRKLYDRDGKPITFNSMVDAMNFMAADGWEFVQAYVTTSGKEGKFDSITHWVLRLDTSRLSEEEKERILKKLNTPKPQKQ